MVKDKGFYDILGVEPDATESQIKSAYKKSALKFHPDKNHGNIEAQEKFQKLSEAYGYLSDPEKRAIYDKYGKEGLEQGGMGGGGMAAEDLFAQFFGGGGGFGDMFPGGMRTGPKKKRPIEHTHYVSLEDMYSGKVSKLALQRSVICSKCNGVGGKKGAVVECRGCNGQGRKRMMRQMGPIIQRFETVCPDCKGAGEIIDDKTKCKQCLGKKTVVERKVLQVNVDKGVKSGAKVCLSGEGDQGPGVEAGDVEIVIEQKPHPHARFQRNNEDLIYRANIDLFKALTGGVIHIEHLDDRWLAVEVTPGEVITPGSVKVVRNQGMPTLRHHDYGHLYVHFNVVFPEQLGGPNGEPMSEEQVKALQSVIPPRMAQDMPPPDAITEECTLEDVSNDRESNKARGAVNSDDEDEEMGGTDRVQCASQ